MPVVGNVAGGREGACPTLQDRRDGFPTEGGNRLEALADTAENIINWRTERVNGRNVLTMVALAEKANARGQRTEDGGQGSGVPS
jgi:hypothetical protein